MYYTGKGLCKEQVFNTDDFWLIFIRMLANEPV